MENLRRLRPIWVALDQPAAGVSKTGGQFRAVVVDFGQSWTELASTESGVVSASFEQGSTGLADFGQLELRLTIFAVASTSLA